MPKTVRLSQRNFGGRPFAESTEADMRGYFDKESGRFQLRPDDFKFLDGLAKLRLIRVGLPQPCDSLSPAHEREAMYSFLQT
jgi:hypothetical protein